MIEDPSTGRRQSVSARQTILWVLYVGRNVGESKEVSSVPYIRTNYAISNTITIYSDQFSAKTTPLSCARLFNTPASAAVFCLKSALPLMSA